jgi:hypothetical protein
MSHVVDLRSEPDKLQLVQQRLVDDLPKHVKGDHITWTEFENSDDNCYMIKLEDGQEVPVEFVNDRWHYLAIRDDGHYYTSLELEMDMYEQGTGWWIPTDPSHPQYETPVIAMDAPREAPQIEESSSGEQREEVPKSPIDRVARLLRKEADREKFQMSLEARYGKADSSVLAEATKQIVDVSSKDFGKPTPPPGYYPELTKAERVSIMGKDTINYPDVTSPEVFEWIKQMPVEVGGITVAPVMASKGKGTMGGAPSGGPPGGTSSEGAPKGAGGSGPPGGAPGDGPPEGIGSTTTGPPAAPNGGGMKGNPPTVFNGDRSKSEEFLKEMKLYWMANSRTPSMQLPYERVAIALGYIRGPKVDNWVLREMNIINRLVTSTISQIPLNDETLWNTFEAHFKTAFTDTAKVQKSQGQLLTLKMKPGAIDDYIAEFERLADSAGWGRNDRGTIIQFKDGLPDALHKAVLLNVRPTPTTLEGWEDAAREQHELWVEIQASLGHRTPYGRQQRWQQVLGPKKQPRRDPNAMDVDGAKISTLTVEERKRLQQEGRCFGCKKQGHLSRNCPDRKKLEITKGQNEGIKAGNRQGMVARVTETKKGGDVDHLASTIEGLTEEEKNALLDKLMVSWSEESTAVAQDF